MLGQGQQQVNGNAEIPRALEREEIAAIGGTAIDFEDAAVPAGGIAQLLKGGIERGFDGGGIVKTAVAGESDDEAWSDHPGTCMCAAAFQSGIPHAFGAVPDCADGWGFSFPPGGCAPGVALHFTNSET